MSEECPACFSETYRKARKLHKCCECKQEIKSGERYRYTSAIWIDKPEAFKQCGTCAAIFDTSIDLAREHDYSPDEYPSYGYLTEFVLNEINGYPGNIERFDFCNSTYWAQRIDEYTKE